VHAGGSMWLLGELSRLKKEQDIVFCIARRMPPVLMQCAKFDYRGSQHQRIRNRAVANARL
jgi:hypothetical protein